MDSVSNVGGPVPVASTAEGDITLLGVIEAEISAGNVDLPPLPEVALRVRELIAKDGDLAAIAQLIEREPAYAAAILRYANSVAFAGLKQIADLQQAMARLGLKAVEQTVLAISARSAFQPSGPVDDQIFRRLWDHSFATAVAARRLTTKNVGTELAFLAGLLHDVGKVVVLRCASDLREQSPDRFSFSDRVLIEFLDELHCRVGDAFLASWNIPEEVREAVRRHHDASFTADDVLPAIVSCADLVAQKLGASLRPNPDLHLLECPAAQVLRLDDVRLANLLIDVEDDIERFRGES
jgi:putative nucleotidyltransferase with HDIG domain